MAQTAKASAAGNLKASAIWQEFLSRSHQHAQTTWADFRQRHANDSVFVGMADQGLAQRLFQKQTASLLEAAGKRQSAAQAASAFTDLLSQLQPPLTPSSSWFSVKSQVVFH